MMPDEKIEEPIMVAIANYIKKYNLPVNKALGISLIAKAGEYITDMRVYRFYNEENENSEKPINYIYILVDIVDVSKPKVFARSNHVGHDLFGNWALRSQVWTSWNIKVRRMSKEMSSWD